jgi:hypothetical protein
MLCIPGRRVECSVMKERNRSHRSPPDTLVARCGTAERSGELAKPSDSIYRLANLKDNMQEVASTTKVKLDSPQDVHCTR